MKKEITIVLLVLFSAIGLKAQENKIYYSIDKALETP
ncbi:MAG: hypothetical protein ACJA2M_003076, partial [Polaribacter sp.]